MPAVVPPDRPSTPIVCPFPSTIASDHPRAVEGLRSLLTVRPERAPARPGPGC